MKKKILSQLMILSFAFAGLFLVGNNLFGGIGVIIVNPGGDKSCTSQTRCLLGMGDVTNEFSGKIYCCNTASSRGYARN